MLITRTSMFTGKTHTLDIDCTQEQLDNYYKKGMYIQEAFSNLSASDREFIKTGVTEEEWNETFGDEDDEEDYDDDYDGQPDEAQEWHDFNPDC